MVQGVGLGVRVKVGETQAPQPPRLQLNFDPFENSEHFLPHRRSEFYHEISPIMPLKLKNLMETSFFMLRLYRTNSRLNHFVSKQLTNSRSN